ncbi:MAG: molybdopterin-dependent oxidoreductase [Acidobacteria bacterium]|nr:molybdopterin-dependent oxidoreductase [Acidobacteriota bacterium]
MAVEIRRTVCNRDCPDACGILATVENGRGIRLGGDPEHPVTKGFLCSRTSRFLDRHYSAERITEPLLRTAGGFVPVSWQEAIRLSAENLLRIRRESGPAAILHYRSGGSLGLLKSVVDYFFELFGPVSVKRGDICSGAGDAAQETDFGEEESHDLFDLLNSKAILLWGKNPKVSNVHLLPVLKEAKKKGCRIILIDPIRHKTASLADHVILPRPGSDFSLAMGVARRLFDSGSIDPEASSYCDNFEAFASLSASKTVAEWAEEADVTEAEIGVVAAALAERPASIQVGWGMGRRVNGSAIVRALDALGAISGNLGIPGGGVSFYFKRRGAFDVSFLKKEWPRTLLEPRLGHEILAAADPPVRAVWITAGNPVAMLPESGVVAQALETRDFVVTVDSFLTDTARRSHLVLPTTTLLEDDDLLGAYGNHWIGASVPVLERPEGVRSDLEIIQLLAGEVDRQTGAGEAGLLPKIAGSALEWKRRLLKKAEPFGVTAEVLEKRSVRNPLAPQVLFADRKFPTASGRMRLVTERPPVPEEEPGFSLWLFSNSTENAQSSQWAGPVPSILPATVHPAAVPGFSDGEEIWIESAVSRMRARLRFDASQRKDVVLVPKGGHYDNGTCANALVKARTTDAGEGAAYQDCRVRITR